DRQSALLAHNNIVDVADRAQHADAAHVDRLLADRDRPAADVSIAGRDRIDDLRQGKAIGPHPVEIDFDLVFLGFSTERRDIGNTGNDAQLALDNPILDRLELDQVHAGRTFELVAQDLADAARRGYDRGYGCGQGRVFQPVGDLLAHEIVVA